jgi:hypothetical protein
MTGVQHERSKTLCRRGRPSNSLQWPSLDRLLDTAGSRDGVVQAPAREHSARASVSLAARYTTRLKLRDWITTARAVLAPKPHDGRVPQCLRLLNRITNPADYGPSPNED